VTIKRYIQTLFENQSIRGFKFSFQNWFWKRFSNSGLSQICKIWYNYKLPSAFLRTAPISSSLKTSWSLKISFWDQNHPISSKKVMKNFTHVKLRCKSQIQNDVFKFQEVFSALGNRVFLEMHLDVSRHFLFYRLETNQRF
jgi:hypothetical protein